MEGECPGFVNKPLAAAVNSLINYDDCAEAWLDFLLPWLDQYASKT